MPQDIAILQRHRNGHEKLAQELKQRGIPCTLARNELDFTGPAVKICTFHSAKGLEFEVVFICGLEEFKVNQPVDTNREEFQQLLDRERKLLYVGMTRSLQILILTASDETPFTEDLLGKPPFSETILKEMWHGARCFFCKRKSDDPEEIL